MVAQTGMEEDVTRPKDEWKADLSGAGIGIMPDGSYRVRIRSVLQRDRRRFITIATTPDSAEWLADQLIQCAKRARELNEGNAS